MASEFNYVKRDYVIDVSIKNIGRKLAGAREDGSGPLVPIFAGATYPSDEHVKSIDVDHGNLDTVKRRIVDELVIEFKQETAREMDGPRVSA